MGSLGTVEQYVQGVKRFIEFLDYSDPETVLRGLQSGEIDATKKTDRFVDFALRKVSHKTVRSRLFGVKKWCELNEVMVNWDKIEFPTSAEIQEVDRAPTKEDLKSILNHASRSRDRAAIHILASSGLRIGTLLSLVVGDVDFDYQDVARIKVERRKGRKFTGKRGGRGQGRFYSTFITPEAKKALLEYFKERKVSGEKLTLKSPLIRDAYHYGKSIDVTSFEAVWNRLLKRAMLNEKSRKWHKMHVHTLRKYFRSNCVCVDPSYREFWMGHKGGYLDESYFRAEQDRYLSEYRKAIPHLTIYSTGLEEKQLRVKAIMDFAKLQGFTDERLKRLEEILAKAKDIDEGIRRFRRFQEKPETMTDGNGKYAVVHGETELLQRLENGWKLVQPLNEDKYLLQIF